MVVKATLIASLGSYVKLRERPLQQLLAWKHTQEWKLQDVPYSVSQRGFAQQNADASVMQLCIQQAGLSSPLCHAKPSY